MALRRGLQNLEWSTVSTIITNLRTASCSGWLSEEKESHDDSSSCHEQTECSENPLNKGYLEGLVPFIQRGNLFGGNVKYCINAAEPSVPYREVHCIQRVLFQRY